MPLATQPCYVLRSKNRWVVKLEATARTGRNKTQKQPQLCVTSRVALYPCCWHKARRGCYFPIPSYVCALLLPYGRQKQGKGLLLAVVVCVAALCKQLRIQSNRRDSKQIADKTQAGVLLWLQSLATLGKQTSTCLLLPFAKEGTAKPFLCCVLLPFLAVGT